MNDLTPAEIKAALRVREEEIAIARLDAAWSAFLRASDEVRALSVHVYLQKKSTGEAVFSDNPTPRMFGLRVSKGRGLS